MAVHAIPVVAQQIVFFSRQAAPVVQEPQVFIHLRPAIGCHQGNRHAGVAESEPIPIRRGRRGEVGRVVGGGLQQRAPADAGVTDDRQAKRPGDGEDVRLRAAMGGGIGRRRISCIL